MDVHGAAPDRAVAADGAAVLDAAAGVGGDAGDADGDGILAAEQQPVPGGPGGGAGLGAGLLAADPGPAAEVITDDGVGPVQCGFEGPVGLRPDGRGEGDGGHGRSPGGGGPPPSGGGPGNGPSPEGRRGCPAPGPRRPTVGEARGPGARPRPMQPG